MTFFCKNSVTLHCLCSELVDNEYFEQAVTLLALGFIFGFLPEKYNPEKHSYTSTFVAGFEPTTQV